MKRILFTLLSAILSGPALAQSSNPLTNGARQHYGIIRGYVTRAAAKIPEDLYAYRATPEVRYGSAGDYSGIESAPSVGPCFGSTISIREFTITPLG